MQPKLKSVITPALLLPASRSMRINGIGRANTMRSKTMLVTEWVKYMGKNSSGILVPQPMHFPGIKGCQYFGMGSHEKRARKKNVKPHNVVTAIRAHVSFRARRYLATVVDEANSPKRRRYWNRMDSLIKVALAQYEAFAPYVCCGRRYFTVCIRLGGKVVSTMKKPVIRAQSSVQRCRPSPSSGTTSRQFRSKREM